MEEINRWRLILGKNSQTHLDFDGEELHELQQMEDALDYLYSKDNEDQQRHGGREGSKLTPISWINKVRKLFPQDTIGKKMEKLL